MKVNKMAKINLSSIKKKWMFGVVLFYPHKNSFKVQFWSPRVLALLSDKFC